MKQRKATHQKSVYSYNKWKKRKIFVMLSLLSLLGFCLVLTHNSTTTNTTTSRILTLASLPSHFIVQKPKIAFLFIARNRLPLDMLWDLSLRVRNLDFPFLFTQGLGFCSTRQIRDLNISLIVKLMTVYRWIGVKHR